jgi:Tol biopolymer transport system component
MFAAAVAVAGAGADAARTAFPGLNGAIVYLSTSAPNLRNLELYAVAPAGGRARPLGDVDPAAEADPAWSPDGRRLAFARGREGSWDIYVREANGSVVPVTSGPANDRNPSWSPDGRRIAFDSDRRGTPEIHVVGADGTGVVRLTTNTAPPPRFPNVPVPGDRVPDWSNDGRTIVFGRIAPGANGIYAVDAGGGSERRLTAASEFAVHASPIWSPDGREIAFNRTAETDRAPTTVWLMRPDGSDQRRILGSEYASGPEWSPDGARLAFVRGREVVTIGRDGGSPRELADEAEPGSRPAWSPDGSRIVFASMIDDGPFRPFRIDPATGRAALFADRPDPTFLASPTWSPDGSRLALVVREQLAILGADGSGFLRVRGTGRPISDPDWSPDGSRLVFVRPTVRGRAGDLFVARDDGSGVRRLTRTSVAESEPAWSPDGRWIAFVANGEIELIRPDGTGRRRLTRNAYDDRSPDWSPDGRRLVFVSGRNPQAFNPELWVANADGSEERRIQPASGNESGHTIWSDEQPVWSPDGRWIAYASNIGDDVYIVRPDGSRKTNLTSDHRSRDTKPTWQPLCNLRGTDGPDVLRGGRGNELVCGSAGPDRLSGGSGRDRLFGGAGDDRIAARDGAFDVVGCGPGRDSVSADSRDLVGIDCERVARGR